MHDGRNGSGQSGRLAPDHGAGAAVRARPQHARTRSRSAPSISASIASAPSATTRCSSRGPRKALAALGLAKGERVAIMGDVCEEWLICDLAAQSLGAIVYGIYPTARASRSRVPDARRRRVDLHRGGPGVRRQDPAADRPAAGRARDRHDRCVGDVRLRPSEADELQDAGRGAAGPDLDWLAARAAAIKPRGSGLHRLHLGHDRQSEGRAGRARQASRRRRDRRRTIIRRSTRRSTARSSTCRSAMCSGAMSR